MVSVQFTESAYGIIRATEQSLSFLGNLLLLNCVWLI